jgi:hypothetical protein
MLQKFYAFLLALGLSGCPVEKPCPAPQPCPSCPDNPNNTCDPNTICDPPVVCPPPEQCPDCPECPPPPECPPAPECPPPPECPKPPPPPVYEDVEFEATGLRINTVLAKAQTLGFYIADPTGQYDAGVIAIPELRVRDDYTQILTLDVGGPETLDIGSTDGRTAEHGLTTALLCRREFADMCKVKVVTNGPDIIKIVITDAADPDNVYVWEAQKK